MQMERDLKAWNGMRDEVLMAQFEGRMKEYARAKGAFEAVVRSHNRISSELSVERALTSRLLSQLEEEETRQELRGKLLAEAEQPAPAPRPQSHLHERAQTRKKT